MLNQPTDSNKSSPILDDFVETKNHKSRRLLVSSLIILLAGILSGYLLSTKLGKSSLTSKLSNQTSKESQTSGSDNNKTFLDSAEGQLEEGGIDGEGTHKLIRPGGPSQTVYLTSSVLDLNQYVNKKVKVWGDTFSAQQAGWLMDVGKVEILN